MTESDPPPTQHRRVSKDADQAIDRLVERDRLTGQLFGGAGRLLRGRSSLLRGACDTLHRLGDVLHRARCADEAWLMASISSSTERTPL